jgi:hypothetical protein
MTALANTGHYWSTLALLQALHGLNLRACCPHTLGCYWIMTPHPMILIHEGGTLQHPHAEPEVQVKCSDPRPGAEHEGV